MATWIGANQVAERSTGWGWFVILGLLVGIVGTAVGIYFLRGQGPTTDEVEYRLARERAGRAEDDRQAAQLNPAAESRAAQVRATADPDTLQSVNTLQKLFDAHVMTKSEHETAMEKLIGASLSAQLAQLNEQYGEGRLSEVQRAAAIQRLIGRQ